MRFKIGVLGATGYIGTPYRREIRESGEADLVALCARRQDRLAAAAAEDGAVLKTDNWREVVKNPDVDLVLILTPDAMHFEQVKMCVKHGKHVFCEKPIGMHADQAFEMHRDIQEAGLASYVPYWTRYAPIFVRAKELVDEGRLGDIKHVVYRWHNPRPMSMPHTWRDDIELSAAGSLADVGSHAYDALRFILNDEARQVVARTDVLMPPKPDLGSVDLSEAIEWGQKNSSSAASSEKKGTAPDFAQVLIEFQSGISGTMLLSHASYLRKGLAPELELHGTDGSLAVDRVRGQLWFADSPDPAELLEEVSDTQFNRFASFVFPSFREQLQGEPTSHPNIYDGWRTQIFTDAAVASAARKTWVELREFEKEL